MEMRITQAEEIPANSTFRNLSYALHGICTRWLVAALNVFEFEVVCPSRS